jgi:dCTP diphosphatase
MQDESATIAQLKSAVERFIKEREWESFHHPKDLAISLSLEAAELLEHFQWDEPRPVEALRKDGELCRQVADELADILHYVLNFSSVLQIDLAKALQQKMEQNAQKYPVEASRGKRFRAHHGRLRRERTLTDDEI